MTTNDPTDSTLEIYGVNLKDLGTEVEVQLKFSDFPYACRLCLQKSDDLKSIQGIITENGVHLTTILINDYEIEINNDQLPQNICNSCKNRIIDAFEMKLQCKRSEQALKSFLQMEELCEIKIIDVDEIKVEGPSDQENEDITPGDTLQQMKPETSTEPKVRSKKSQKMYKCPYCDEEFNQRDYRQHRVETGHANTCKICHREFKKKGDLDRHIERHKRDSGSADNKYQCDICLKRFFLAGSLNHHKRMHELEPSFVCEVCGRRFKQKISLDSHLLSHRNGTIGCTECSICNHKFNNDSALTLHMFRMHREFSENRKGRDYKCEICNQGFFRKSALTRHMLLHKSDNQCYLCNECGKQFSNQNLLNAHIKLHSNVAAFPCPVCEKAFTQMHYMRRHLKSHANTRPYKCDICNKTFKYDNITRHKLMHTGVKPHSCNVCGKAFSRKHILTIHLRTHTGDLPFQCDVCEERFKDPSVFSRHKKVHEKPKDVE